jgi:hypothetical protein
VLPQRSAHPLARLRDPGTVRARCNAILRSVQDGVSPHFSVNLDRLDDAADRVATLTLARFPTLDIPFHSRWRHFEAGGVDRKAELDRLLAGRSPDEVARAYIDLTVVSVLLDAGAGAQWQYVENDADGTAHAYSRSEGLGVASFRAFVEGRFSAHADDPCRADAAVLSRVDVSVLRSVFQVTPNNPMVGLEGRAALLSTLGTTLQAEAAAHGSSARPSQLWDRLLHTPDGSRPASVSATRVLGDLLAVMAPIWTSGSRVQGLPGGDVWPHLWAGAGTAQGNDPTTGGWVPFHKLSQWMTYSLLEPLQWAGLPVTDLDALTGLPEYRNGGLLLDTGVIVPRRPAQLAKVWKPADPFIVEWRALTVALLDLLAERVRAKLGKTAAELPLACILEGGTWAAGREIAAELREGGPPPLKIDSDGTVF